MRILITGATGLIGSEVTKTLSAAGHDVLATDLKAGALPLNVKFELGNLESGDFIGKLDFRCDAVIHFGSIPRPHDDLDEEVFRNNVMGTYRVFSQAVQNKVPLVIYASSLSIYGTAWSGPWTSPRYVPVDEIHPLQHYESYALSKEVNERSADMWAHRSETAFVGFRFPFCNTSSAIREFAKKMMRGDQETLMTGAKILWGYLDTRDATQGVITVLGNGAKGSKTFNFAAPDTMAPRPTLDMLAEFHPTAQVISPLVDFSSVVNCQPWRDDYGYEPRYLLNRNDLGKENE